MDNSQSIVFNVWRAIGALLLSIAAVSVFFFVGFWLLSVAYDCSIAQVFTRASVLAPENATLIRLTAMIQTVGLFGVSSVVFAAFYGRNMFPFLKMNKLPRKRLTFYVLATMLVSIPFINFLGEFNKLSVEALLGENNSLKLIEENALRVMLLILGNQTVLTLFANLFVVALLPALCEELFFRGVVQRGMLSLTGNIHVSILFAAFLFSAAHMQFYGFLPRMLLGVFFGYLLQWTRSLWLPVLAHFVNNAAIVLLYFILPAQTMANLETLGGDAETLLLGLISGLLVAAVVYRIVTRYAIQNTILR